MRLKSRRGAELVEMALVMPLLVLLVFGTIDFGLLIYNKAVITNASREGARAGIAYAPSPGVDHLDATAIKTVVTDYCNNYLVTFGTHVLAASDVTVANAAGASGGELAVTLTYPHKFLVISTLIPGLSQQPGVTDVTLTSTTKMRLE